MAERIGVGRSTARNTVDAAFEKVGEEMGNSEEVRATCFGILWHKKQFGRSGVKNAQLRVLPIPASTASAFKLDKALKEFVIDVNAS